MRTKRNLSKILAFVLCLQMLLSNFGQAGIVYAAEQDNTEASLSEEAVMIETFEEDTKGAASVEETPAEKTTKTAAAAEEVKNTEPLAETGTLEEIATLASAEEKEPETSAEKKTTEEMPPETTTGEAFSEDASAPETSKEKAEPEETRAPEETSTALEQEASKEQETGSHQDKTEVSESSSENAETSEEGEAFSAESTETGSDAETKENSEETEETTETDEEEKWNSTPITGNAVKEGVTISVSAPEGSFPEGTVLTIKEINASQTEEIIRAINDGQEAVAFDVSFFGLDGEKVQPREGYYVDVRFEVDAASSLADPDGDGATLHAYHIAESGHIEALGSLDAPEGETAQIHIKADDFSPYVLLKNTPEEARNANRDLATSTNLADFLVEIECNAPVDENGNYIIDPNRSYEMTFIFQENEGLQFDNEADLVYDLPEGLIVPASGATSFDINISDGEGAATVYGNTFEVVDGRLIVRFNQSDPNIERLKAVANANFRAYLSVRIDENAGSIVFNSDIEKDFVFETSSDLTIDKAVTYDLESDTASYVITVTSEGHNENVAIQDILSGTALVLNHDVTVSSSINGELTPEIDYESISNGFSFTLAELQHKEVLTIQCTAAVDNTKISGNGTVDQTKNTARVTSDQTPDGKEASADFAGQAKFERVKKYSSGDPVQIGENLYEQEWLIRVNRDHKVHVGGAYIYDWIVPNSRPFMLFTGDGITANVTMEDGSTETREIPWSELQLYENSNGTYGWGYLAPESDGKASYEIICKTLINTANALNDLTLVNGAQVYGSYDEGQTTITGVGENVFSIKKRAVGTTSTQSEWELTVTVPGSGLPQLRVVDDLPRLDYNGQTYIDSLVEGSMDVTGLLEGESWRLALNSTSRRFTVYFYKSADQSTANEGALPTSDGEPRDIVIRFKTNVNQEWLSFAAEDGYQDTAFLAHTNVASVRSGDNRPPSSSDYVVPVRPNLVKNFVERDEVEIDGVTYPVFSYSLGLYGPTVDGITIQDIFNTEYLKFYETNGVQVLGGYDYSPTDSNGTASASNTAQGMSITVSSFPKNSEGEFYPYYEVKYSLIVKDEDALAALNDAAALSQAGIDLENTATWDSLSSSRIVNYTHFPYVDKELVSQASADNDYVAEFKLIINPYADDLDPASDMLNVQDELSANLRFMQGSIVVSPENDSVTVGFDSASNTLTFLNIPDNTRFEITYQARVLGKGNVTYSNTVKLGNYEKTVEDEAKIESTGSGSGSNPGITLVKRDAENVDMTLGGASFQLFYLRDTERVPVTDRNGNNVVFTTGADGTVLIAGNQTALGWTLWEGRTYQLIELSAPEGYQINENPTEFILSDTPSSQLEYDLTGDSVTAWDTKIKTEVSVTKQWIGPATESVTVYLKVGDETINTATLNEGNNWQYTFTGIDKYNDNGEEIAYKVEEAPLDNYSEMTTGNMSDGYVIINTDISTINIPVRKEWIGAPAERVIVNLTADNEVVDEAELSAETGWEYVFSNLPKYDTQDGHEIVYDIQEERLEGYAPAYGGSVADGITIINTNTEMIEIPVKKIWIGPAPEKLTVILYADAEEKETIELREENEWSYSFTGLNRYDPTDGHEIEYSVEEEDLANYRSEKDGSIQDGITFTNVNTETIDIPVEKKWIGPAGESVTIRLFADRIEIDDTTLSEETSWKHTFTDLPKYDSSDGHVIQYDVREDPLEGYEPRYQGDEEQGYVITNTITEKISIPVAKVWIGPATESIAVNLLADKTKVAEAELNEENGWKYTFENLEKYNNGEEIEYTVEEVKIDNYESEIAGDQEQGYIITNTNTEKTEISVTKQWVGTPADAVTINLLADKEIIETIELTAEADWKHLFTGLPKYSTVDGHRIAYSVSEEPLDGYVPGYSGTEETGYTITNTITGKVSVPVTKIWVGPAADSVTVELLADGTKVDEVQLSEENDWQYTFRDLEKYDDGKEILYEIAEVKIDGYSSEILGSMDGYTVKNTNTATISIPVRKVWIGPAAESVTIRLFSDGTEKETVSLTEDNGWKHEFANLPKYDAEDGHEIAYDVQEDIIPGYDPQVTDTTKEVIFTNTNIETLDIPVEKKWIGPSAKEATIRLMADGTEKESIVLSDAAGWTHTFAGLPKYDNEDGHEIEYLLMEDEIAGYKSFMSGTITDGIIFTNTNTETVDIPVEKKWVGEEVSAVTIRLFADGSEAESTVLTGETHWKHTFSGLLKYDGTDGHEIKYTVKEDVIEGYNVSISGSVSEGYTVTNTIIGKVSFSVSKNWIGQAADSVEIYLLADGEILQEVKLNATNSWKHTFAGLEQYKDGTEIKYTIQEKEIPGYHSSITGSVETGFSITNANTRTMDIPVEKKWVGSEGGSITIRLYADGVEIDRQNLTKSGGWKSKFSDLPVYDKGDGHEIVYTITEDNVEGYTSKISGSAVNGYTATNTKKETPETDPKKPTTTTNRSSNTPKTGDDSNIALWLVIMLISGGLLLFLFYRRRRRSKTQ